MSQGTLHGARLIDGRVSCYACTYVADTRADFVEHMRSAHDVNGSLAIIDDAQHISDQPQKAHGELLDDGSYRCLLKWGTGDVCHTIEWDRAAFLWHVKNVHSISEEIVIAGEPAPIVHRSAYHDRVEGENCNYHGCLREKAFADAWVTANVTLHVLASLSTRVVKRGAPGAKVFFGPHGGEYRARSWSSNDDGALYTQRDATVAATIVQWLGTNVGFDWLETTLRAAGYVVELKSVRDGRDKRQADAVAHALRTIQEALSQLQ